MEELITTTTTTTTIETIETNGSGNSNSLFLTTPLRMAERFDELFTQYDKNGDGFIDYGEWNDLIHKSDETSLNHLNETDAHMLFTVLSNYTGLIKYPELIQELTIAAQQNPTMAPNEFINSFFARFLAVKEKKTRQLSLNSPSISIVGGGISFPGVGASSRAYPENSGEMIELLQKKNDQLKQQMKDKEVEWAEEKIGLQSKIERLELINEQMKHDNEEMENELKQIKSLEMEHYINKEDKNVMKEQMFEMEDDIRRVQNELERVNSLNLHLKQQLDLYSEQKQKLTEENRAVLREKQDIIQESKLIELKLETTRNKFEEMCEKHQQLQLQMEETEQLYKQQLRQMELQMHEQQLDANIVNANMKARANSNVNINTNALTHATRHRSGTLHMSGSVNPIDIDISPRDSYEPFHRGYTPSLGGKSNSQYPLDLAATTPQRKMTNQDLFEFYKEHHRKNSLSAPPPPMFNKHSKVDSISIINIDEHKVDESGVRNTTRIDRDWPQTMESILKEQMNGLKQMIRGEFEQLDRELVNSTEFRQNLNRADDIIETNTLNNNNNPQPITISSKNGDIEQALQGVEKLLDQKLQQLVVQVLDKESRFNSLIKVLQDQIEEYKSQISQMNIKNSNNNDNNNNNNNNNTNIVEASATAALPPQQMTQLLSYFEKSEQNVQGVTRELKKFLEEVHLKDEKTSSNNTNILTELKEPSTDTTNDNNNNNNNNRVNEVVTQMTVTVKESLQGISQHLEQLKLENVKIQEENSQIKDQNRDLIETVKELTKEKDELAESKRAMVRKLNGEMDNLRKEITQIKKQQTELEFSDQEDQEKQGWFGGIFNSWISL